MALLMTVFHLLLWSVLPATVCILDCGNIFGNCLSLTAYVVPGGACFTTALVPGPNCTGGTFLQWILQCVHSVTS